jgi:N utilization substance protein B
LERIDSIIDQFAEGWSTERMPIIDKALLRMATYEVLYRLDIPIEAILSEAVALASEYSTEQSSRFINGVVASISEETRTDSN